MNNLVVFVKEAWAELKQVSWLTPAQMIASTWLVIVLCALMAVYIAKQHGKEIPVRHGGKRVQKYILAFPACDTRWKQNKR